MTEPDAAAPVPLCPPEEPWTCPACGALCGPAVESCEGGIDIPDSERGETELIDSTHPPVMRPQFSLDGYPLTDETNRAFNATMDMHRDMKRLKERLAKAESERSALAADVERLREASRDDVGTIVDAITKLRGYRDSLPLHLVKVRANHTRIIEGLERMEQRSAAARSTEQEGTT